MSPDLKKLPPVAARRLREYYRRKRFYAGLRVLLAASSVYLLLALVVMHFDRFLFLDASTRLLMTTIVHSVGIIYALTLAALFALRRISTQRLAYELESRLPADVAERFVTLASLDATAGAGAERDVSQALVDQLVRETVAYSESFFGSRLVLDRRFRLLGGVAALLLVVYGLLLAAPGYQFDLMIQRFLAPRANLPKPSFVTLAVSPEAAVLGRGGEIVIQARTEGAIPPALDWIYRLAGIMPGDCVVTIVPANADLPPQTLTMSRIQRTLFLYSMTDLQEGFAFRVRAADAETALLPVEVVVQPTITETALVLTPPAYTRLPNVTLTNNQDAVNIYARTQVELTFSVDQDVAELSVSLPGERTARPEWDPQTRTGSYRFDFTEPFDMQITAVNERGFANTVPVRIAFRLREDQRPTVSLQYPTSDLAAVPGELIPLQFRIEDDLGIDQLFIQFMLNPDDEAGRPPQELAIALDEAGEARALDMTYMLDLEMTAAVPGDKILFLIRARDSGGNDGESRAITVSLSAFARGENERRRLEVLAFIQNALQLLAQPDADADALGTSIREMADKLAIPLEPGTLTPALLLLMDQEYHFTDHPLHKADMQKLAGLVRAAAIADAAEPDAALLQQTAEAIPGLVTGRRLQSAIWAYFGLVYELESIRERMGETEAQRRQLAVTAETVLSAHARALAEAARADAGLRQQAARLAEQQAALATASKAMQQKRQELEDELPPGMGTAFQQDSPELRRLITAVADQRAAVAAIEQQIKQQAGELGKAVLTNEQRLFVDRHIDSAVLQAIRARIVTQVAAEPDTALDPLLPEMIAKSLPEFPPPAGDMQSINRRIGLFLRSAENTGASLAGIAWDSDFDLRALRLLQSNLNAAIHRMTRTSETLVLRAASASDLHDQVMAIISLLVEQMPPLRARETLARRDLELAGQMARAQLQGRKLDDWLLADLTLTSFNAFADLAPALHAIALLENRNATPSRLQNALAALSSGVPATISGQGLLLAFDQALQELLDHRRIHVAERDLALRFMAFDAAMFFGAVTPADRTSAWHAAIAEFNPHQPATAPVSRQTLLEGIDLSSAAGPPPALRTLLAEHVVPDARQALQDILRHWRTTEAMFETTSSAIRAGNESMEQPFTRLLQEIQADINALESFILRLQLRLAWLPEAPPPSAQHLLLLRLRELVGRFRGRSATALATLESFTRRPMRAADATEVLASIQALALNLKVLREAGENLLKDDQAFDASRYALLTTFAETALLRSLANSARDGEAAAAIATRYIEAFPQAAAYFVADRKQRLTAAGQYVGNAIEELEAETITAAAVDSAIEAAISATGAFVDALDAVDNAEVTRLRDDARQLRNRIAAQRFGDTAPESGAIRQRLFNLTESASQLARLVSRIPGGPEQATAPAALYSGGPDNIWSRENRMHAEHARNRTQAQARHADRRIAIAMLATLLPDAHDHQETSQDALHWSEFQYRLARSPLTGAVRAAVAAPPATATVDPLTQWLMRQLDEARTEAARDGNLREYRRQTIEWIDSLRDFLRY